MLKPKSIRPFIGSKNFEISRAFYSDLGFKEIITSSKMSYFSIDNFGFYLQDYYVKDWVDNSMIFLEVEDVERHYELLKSKNLPAKYNQVKLKPVVYNDWGNEFFLHDPSNILWHIGEFKSL